MNRKLKRNSIFQK